MLFNFVVRSCVFPHELAQGMHPFGEILLVPLGPVAHVVSVIIDSLWRAVKEFRDFHAVGYSEPDQGIDSQFGIEQFALLGHHMLVV